MASTLGQIKYRNSKRFIYSTCYNSTFYPCFMHVLFTRPSNVYWYHRINQTPLYPRFCQLNCRKLPLFNSVVRLFSPTHIHRYHLVIQICGFVLRTSPFCESYLYSYPLTYFLFPYIQFCTRWRHSWVQKVILPDKAGQKYGWITKPWMSLLHSEGTTIVRQWAESRFLTATVYTAIHII
jgi:hypothetical protein